MHQTNLFVPRQKSLVEVTQSVNVQHNFTSNRKNNSQDTNDTRFYRNFLKMFNKTMNINQKHKIILKRSR